MCVSLEKEVTRKQQRQQYHEICQTNASIVNQVLHECNLQSVKTTLTKDQIRHLIIFLSSSIFICALLSFVVGFERKNIVRMVRMPRASRMSNAFPAVRSAVCSSYSPKVPFTTRKRTSSRYSDTVRGYGTKSTTTTTTTLEIKKEREEKRRERITHFSQRKERNQERSDVINENNA